MEKYILISVHTRNIETKYFNDFQSAYEKMVEELDETGNRNDYADGEDYEIGTSWAWSNMNDSCDWLVEKLPLTMEEEKL